MMHIVPENLLDYRASRSNLCPVCDHDDWCLTDGVSWALCQRIESPDGRWKDAGWFHRLSTDNPRVAAVRTNPKPTTPPIEKVYPWNPPGNPVAVYYYNRPDGSPLYRKIRYKTSDGKVTPFQRYDHARDAWIGGEGCMKGVERVLYRGEQLTGFQRVFVVEGEKCADCLWDLGILAVCNDSGAGHWSLEFSKALAGKDVVILPDNDEPGRKHGEAVARSLVGVARSIRVVELPGLGPKQDVFDWLSLNGEAL